MWALTLYTKDWLDERVMELGEWPSEAYGEFRDRMLDLEIQFPCILGQKGFRANQLRFAFLSDFRSCKSREELAKALAEYGQQARTCGQYTSFVAFFDTPCSLRSSYGVEDFEQVFWSLLQDIHELDEQSWPVDVPQDVDQTLWEFCFGGEPYFVLCATPAHHRRKSREFPYFYVAFQPRFVFEKIHDQTVFGRKMKERIRERLIEYDEAAIHPALRWYGEPDNREWKQYFLPDDERVATHCPFHAGAMNKSLVTEFTTRPSELGRLDENGQSCNAPKQQEADEKSRPCRGVQ